MRRRTIEDRACGIRWIQTREGDDPPIAVVCRVTALAVGARIKQDVLAALEGLP